MISLPGFRKSQSPRNGQPANDPSKPGPDSKSAPKYDAAALDALVQRAERAAAKAAPGTITYGSPGNGTSIHLAGDLFEKAAGVKLSHIPYKGSNPALMDALAGNVDLLVSSLPSAMGQIKAGKLRPLAVTSAKRSSSLPEVPTVAESGFKDFDVSTWYGVFAPAGTPAAVVTTVNAEINKLLATPDMKAAIQAQGAEPQALSPAQFGALLNKEYVQWKGIVEASGAKIE